MVKATAKVNVPIDKWIQSIVNANKRVAKDIEIVLKSLVEEEIERTWDNNYTKKAEAFANINGVSVTFTWGNDGEPPGILNEGGELTVGVPDGVARSVQISKTLKAPELIPVFRSLEPERSWRKLRQGDQLGQIIPRNFDEQLAREFKIFFKPEIFYRVALRNSGFG